jgi:hypothetical protein
MIETPKASAGINTFTVKQEADGKLLLALTDGILNGFYIYRFDGRNITLIATSKEYDEECCANVAWLD